MFSKKIIVTILKLFFLSPDAKKIYGHNFLKKSEKNVFLKSLSLFEKWTFINVQNRFPFLTFGKNI
jgi:hypothetical protein